MAVHLRTTASEHTTLHYAKYEHLDPDLCSFVFCMQVHSFGELLATRIGFAAAQSTQNPICFSLIPELFPRERTTAIAAYNSAIYIGRALSFATVIVASKLGMSKGGDVTPMMVRPGKNCTCIHPPPSVPADAPAGGNAHVHPSCSLPH